MKILITGGTGFIGSNLAKKLNEHQIFVTGKKSEQQGNLNIIGFDFTNIDWKKIPPIDVIFHQAAVADTLHLPTSDFYAVNLEGSKTLFNQASDLGCKKFIYASSCAVYGNETIPFIEEKVNPLNDYGKSKLLFDYWSQQWAKETGNIVIGLRYSNVFGPGEEHKKNSSSMIYQIFQQMRNHKIKLYCCGEQRRDFVHIADVISANIIALNSNNSGIYNVGSGTNISFNEIVEVVSEIYQTNYSVEYIENKHSDVYQTNTLCDISKMKSLGYNPHSIKKRIEDYINWLLNEN